jgi:hypothetical protein
MAYTKVYIQRCVLSVSVPGVYSESAGLHYTCRVSS